MFGVAMAFAKWFHVPKIHVIPHFFDQAYPTVFDPRDPQGHFSKNISLQNCAF